MRGGRLHPLLDYAPFLYLWEMHDDLACTDTSAGALIQRLSNEYRCERATNVVTTLFGQVLSITLAGDVPTDALLQGLESLADSDIL